MARKYERGKTVFTILTIIGVSCFSLAFWGLMDEDPFKIVIGVIGCAACIALAFL